MVVESKTVRTNGW